LLKGNWAGEGGWGEIRLSISDKIPDPNKIVFESMNITGIHRLPERFSYCTKTCKILPTVLIKWEKKKKSRNRIFRYHQMLLCLLFCFENNISVLFFE